MLNICVFGIENKFMGRIHLKKLILYAIFTVFYDILWVISFIYVKKKLKIRKWRRKKIQML